MPEQSSNTPPQPVRLSGTPIKQSTRAVSMGALPRMMV